MFYFFFIDFSVVQLTLNVVNVHFSSVNFQAFLHWDAIDRADAKYFVQYKVYGDWQWENKSDCWGQQDNWCNLTTVMLSTEHEYENNIARVKAETANESSKWEKSQRFHPVFDATIGPPAVTLKTRHTSILLNITVPWEVQQSKYLKESVNKMHFRITVSQKDSEITIIQVTTSSTWNISNLTPWSQYCLGVLMNFPDIKKTSLPSSEQCVLLKGKRFHAMQFNSITYSYMFLV
uniref:Fibronectin type-III domain-containing protein n=1 Tax=Xenopus tropicalis TaxID=8364 RepID=A0A803JZ85_XENTR